MRKQVAKYTVEKCPQCNTEVNVVSHIWLREARLDARMSLSEIAWSLKVTKSYLSQIELGRKRVTNDIAKGYERAISEKQAQE
jgi:predicted transcriptional regulator